MIKEVSQRPFVRALLPYLAAFFVVVLYVFPLFKMEYSTDTYHLASGGGLNAIVGAMSMNWNGRPVIYGCAYLLSLTGMSITGFYYVSLALSIIFTTLSIATLYKMLKGHMNTPLAFFIAIITIINPLSFEHFLFIEKGFFSFAIYMAILAAWAFARFTMGKIAFLPLSYLFLTLCAFTYQALPAVFAGLAVVFSVIYSKDIKRLLLNLLIAVSVYGVSTFMIFIAMKVFSTTNRVNSEINLHNIYRFLTFSLEEPCLLLIYLGLFLILAGVIFGISKKTTGKFFTKESLIRFFHFSLVVLGTIAATCAPFPFTTKENVYFTIRVAYPIGTLIGTIPILANYKKEYADKDVSVFKKPILPATIAAILILTILFSAFYGFFFSRHITNDSDKADALKIGEFISKYEEESGNKVESICIYKDNSFSPYFEGTIHLPNCNIRAFAASWSDVAHLNVYLERNLKKVEASKEKQAYFATKDFDSVEEGCFIFEGNSLHFCIY